MKTIFLRLASILTLLFAMSMPALAAECTLYEQSHPSFLLDGAHLSTGKCSTCASCHKNGVFIGTSKSCTVCHSTGGLSLTVASVAHIPTGIIECGNCHNTSSFTATWHMNHAVVSSQACSTCHNGAFKAYGASGKGSGHVPTLADCGACHKTTDWSVSIAAIHAGITTNCISCHNNVFAIGKTINHPVTSDACETCHSTTANFKCASLDSNTKYAACSILNRNIVSK